MGVSSSTCNPTAEQHAEQNARDLQIINQRAEYLNREAADVLEYQVRPEEGEAALGLLD